jgi:hypothetical protein
MKINGKQYKTSFGLDLFEYIAEERKLEYIADVIGLFTDIEFENGLRLKDVKTLALLVGSAIKATGEKAPSEKVLKDWVLANPLSAVEVYGEFVKSLPGQGKEDNEGNLEAVKEAATA